MIYDKEIQGDVVDDVLPVVPTRLWEVGTNYWAPTMLHMFLSFSVVSYLSTVQITLSDQNEVTLQLRASKGHCVLHINKIPG